MTRLDSSDKKWEFASLGELGLVRLGQTPKKQDYCDSSDHKILKYRDISDGTIEWDKASKGFVRSSSEALVGLRDIRVGDVLVTASAHSSEHIGRKAALIRSIPYRFKAVFVVGEILQVRPVAGIDPRWVLNFLSSKDGYDLIQKKVQGVHLIASRARDIEIPIAPAEEQRRVCDKIDELFPDLDAGVAALERARANLKRYRAVVLKAAVEGRLTAEWRKAHPDAEPADKLLERILAERRRKWEEAQLAKFAAQGKEPPKGWKDKYPEPAKLETTDLPELPDGWLWMTLDTICEIAGGLTKGGKRKPHEKTRAVPYLRVANVQRGFLDLSEMKTIQATDVEIEELTLKAGDILFNEGGDRDKLGRGWVWAGEIDSCVHQNHVFRARPVFAEIQSKFVSFHGNTFGKNWFQKHGKQSVNLASINMTVLRQFPVPVPPAAEQAGIIEELDSRLTALDYTENQLDDGLARATRLRQAILKRAFEGKLVPQDPSDEPASALLERIRDARAASLRQPAHRRRKSPA